MQFYRFPPGGDPLTAQAGLLIGSLPAVAMIRLLRSCCQLFRRHSEVSQQIIGRMNPKLPINVDCPECEAVLRELLDARERDSEEMRKHLFEAARSSGRAPAEMRNVWLASVMNMPDDEMQTVIRAHAPRATEARRREKSEHEIATGHSVDQLLSMVLLGYRQPPVRKSR